MSRTTRHSRLASSGRIDRFAIYGLFRLMQTLGEQLLGRNTATGSAVSPEFRLRPSLSDARAVQRPDRRLVSPEFRLRPSLSVPGVGCGKGRNDTPSVEALLHVLSQLSLSTSPGEGNRSSKQPLIVPRCNRAQRLRTSGARDCRMRITVGRVPSPAFDLAPANGQTGHLYTLRCSSFLSAEH